MMQSAEVIYNIYIDGIVVANITCSNGTTIMSQCTNNIWNNYTPNMCEKILTNNGNLEKLIILNNLKL